MEMPDFVRFSTAAITAIAMLFFAVRINDDWAALSWGWRTTRLSLLGLIFVLAFASVELALLPGGVPLGSRNVMAFIFIIGLLVGLWLVRHESTPAEAGWLRVAEVRSILDGVEDTHHNEPCHNPGCIAARVRLREMIDAAETQFPETGDRT